VLVVQIAHIPEEINPGLSGPVMAAVPNMCQRVMRIINKEIA